jgi:hypothetical protein
VLFEDEHLLAIDKPAGVAVHGGSGVSSGVIEQLRRARPTARFLELVHRLDRETSGVLLLAKKRSALTAVQDQFRARDTGKIYLALVPGTWPAKLKVIDEPLHKSLDDRGERHVRVVSPAHEDGRRSITLIRSARACGGGLVAAGDQPEDRPHAPDPRAPGACRAPDRGRPEVRRLRAQPRAWPAARIALRACSCTPANWPSTTRPAANASPCNPLACRVRDTPGRTMTRVRRFDLIAFDWDGTLFDSTALITRCIQDACRDLGVAVPSDTDAAYVIGLGLHDALKHAAPGLPRERYPELGQRYRHHYLARQDDLVLFPARWTCCRR